MSYSFIRTCYWIFNIFCSGIGITAFISIIGFLFPQNVIAPALDEEEQLERQEKSDRQSRSIKRVSSICLIALIILACIRFFGRFNIEDVFNGQYRYVGQTLNSKADGYGKQYTVEGLLIYEGDFIANNYEGTGKYYARIEQDDGTEVTRLRYEGEFKAGAYHGKGKKYYADLEDVDKQGKEKPCLMYDGEFDENQFSGHGICYSYKLKSGIEGDIIADSYYKSAEYDGDWDDGMRDGQGVYTFYNEAGRITERYTGGFNENSYDGEGIWEFIDESDNNFGEVVYCGQVKNNKCVGKGVYYNNRGNVITINSEDESKTAIRDRYPFPEDCIWNME